VAKLPDADGQRPLQLALQGLHQAAKRHGLLGSSSTGADLAAVYDSLAGQGMPGSKLHPDVAKLSRDEQTELASRLRCVRLLLAAPYADLGLSVLSRTCHSIAAPLYADVLARQPLRDEQWRLVPAGSPGLGKLLPAVLARSPTEAACLMQRLSPHEQRCLQEYLRCLARLQRERGAALPQHLLCRTLGFL
jgi:hypothetical protein